MPSARGQYICQYCGNVFTYKSALTRHIRDVHGAKDTCSICKKQYSRRSIHRHKCRGATPSTVSIGVQVDMKSAQKEQSVQTVEQERDEWIDDFINRLVCEQDDNPLAVSQESGTAPAKLITNINNNTKN